VRLIFLSGLSGSGKSVALHMLEDLDFYCVDNLPAALLQSFISHTVRSGAGVYKRTAIGIDARNPDADLATVPMLLDELKRSGIQCELLFLIASDEELLRRYAETRRKHPMSRQGESLHDAITLERTVLEPVVNAADLVIDTSRMGVHELREFINRRVEKRRRDRMSLLFESFGFKHGIPGDADFVFDARSLPNPYWEPTLRSLTGRDLEVIRFLESQKSVAQLIDDIVRFIDGRIPEYESSNRGYLTVAIGCTGGQHRSVYIVERLAERYAQRFPTVTARHSGLPLALYVDCDSIYRVNDEEARQKARQRGQKVPLTQFGRAMGQLGVGMIFAGSPQAKGRVERVNRTFQDRLVKELKWLGLTTIAAANAYLDKTFLKSINTLIHWTPTSGANRHQPLARHLKLEDVLCVIQTRAVGQDWCVSFESRILQIHKRHQPLALAGKRVQVLQRADGTLTLKYHDKPLVFAELAGRPVRAPIPQVTPTPAVPRKPGPDHGWRKSFLTPPRHRVGSA